MTKPSCMSSEYNVLQPANCAAATIMPSYTLSSCRSAKASPRTCVSAVTGTTAHSPRMRSDARRICAQLAENLRRIVLAHSSSTCTLTVPPACKSSSEGTARVASPTMAYTRTLVSRNTSVFVIGVAALEAIAGRDIDAHLFAKLADVVESDLAIYLALDLQTLARRSDDFDLVSFGEPELGDKLGGQPHREAVTPFCDLHGNLLDIQSENVYPWAAFVKVDELQTTLQ